jgi:hypothetical protein
MPLAHWLFSLQNAPGGARQLPPVQGVPSGQSLATEQVPQRPPPQKWVMQSAGVHACAPSWMQKPEVSQN